MGKRLTFRPKRPIITINGRAQRQGRNRVKTMNDKKTELEIQKLELEVANLEKDLQYKDLKIKAIAWGIFFSAITLIAKLKGGA